MLSRAPPKSPNHWLVYRLTSDSPKRKLYRMANPHPTPTRLRLLHGDTSKGKNPINTNEPKVPVGAPKMPVVGLIDDLAKKKFRSFCKMIDGYGILSTIEQDQVV